MNVKFCTNCLVMETRPRVGFDKAGRCNACVWSEEKNKVDWDAREKNLLSLLDRHRSKSGGFDCLVPVSGGKDGSYVTYKLAREYGMNPLCVTVTPAMELEIGRGNLRNFIESGFNHMSINISPETLRSANRWGLINKGFPYFGWLTAIAAAPLQIASNFGIGLIFYGEDGEVEYGGESETKQNPIYDIPYIQRVYLEGGYDLMMNDLKEKKLCDQFFQFPDVKKEMPLEIAHWSFFENWDPYRNYLVAKQHCGLKEATETNSGTFTNFAQNDQALYALHTYLMYLKFGFGRANQDASIEIRRGAMSREQAVNLVRLYDGLYPEEFIGDYLDYYQISHDQLIEVFDRYVNKQLFEKTNGQWKPIFEIV